MRQFLIFALAILCLGLITKTDAQSSDTSGGTNNRILVAYFSWSGNAKALAKQIAEETGGDLFEIKTVTAYPETYNETIELAKQEQENNARPALSGSVENMERYGAVFLCYPNWWGTLPMGVFTFLESYDFSGKTIYPLVTHGGSRFGRSLDDIKKLSPKAVIGEGIDVVAYDANPKNGPVVTLPNKEVTSWLTELKMIK
ncbi:MAG: flavodoxin [Deltaproteobacteria bacterium]|jgi:flavodoxin|nr:flavodoxin [Deltaproteobacteria bacterium]